MNHDDFDNENEMFFVTIHNLLNAMISHYETSSDPNASEHKATLKVYQAYLAGFNNFPAAGLVHAWYFGLESNSARKATLAEWLRLAYALRGVTANLTPCAAEIQSLEVMRVLLDGATAAERPDLQAEMDAIHC